MAARQQRTITTGVIAAMRLVFVPLVVAVFLVQSAPAGPGAQRRDGRCAGPATEALVRSFARELGRGHVSAVDRMWAPAGRFVWYSTRAPGPRLGRRAEERSTLVPYLRSRVRARERLRILRVDAGYDPRRRLVDFG